MMLQKFFSAGNRPALFAIGGGLTALIVTAGASFAAFGGLAGDEPEPIPTATYQKRVARLTLTPSPRPTSPPTPIPTPEPVPIEEVQQQIEGPWSLPVDAPPPPAAVTAAPTPPPAAVPSTFLHPPPYKVFIDAGHGGREVGTAGGGWAEKNLNLDIALRLRTLLQDLGYTVVLDRTGDYSLTNLTTVDAIQRRDEIQARVDVANAAGADILVSIHHNGSSSPSVRGTEIYYNPDRPFGNFNLALAQFTQSALVTTIRANGYATIDRGIKNDGLVGGDPRNPHSWILGTNVGFPRPSRMPGIIGEALFMTNAFDVTQIQNANMRQAIAKGYKDGITAYFSWIKAQVPTPTPTPTPTRTPTPVPTPSPTPSATPTPSPTPTGGVTETPTPTESTPTPTSTVARRQLILIRGLPT